MTKKWQILPKIDQEVINSFPEINPIVLQLMNNRGLKTQKAIDEFLNPDYGDDTHDPFLFKDMGKVVERIFQAIQNSEKILVYGDYDADGITSTSVMKSIIDQLGGKTDVYIPFREKEGYGLNLDAVDEIIKNKFNLVITVDCGISNKDEVSKLMENNVDVIVTDHHHEPPELPPALAIINPSVSSDSYPFKTLAGCGVAFKVAQALVSKHGEHKVNQLKEGAEKWLLDLVAIGTIADMMPLVGENRTLVRYGLIVLQKTKRLGIHALAEKMGTKVKDLNEISIGWQISPRLNAAGRLNHASVAYELLVTEDEDRAVELADELNKTNQQRQQITDKIMSEATDILGEVDKQKILIAVGQNWPTGIVGLVSGRFSDKYHRPSLIISNYNGEIIGSGRSIKAFDIIEAIEKCNQYLEKYGGHKQACGFTVKDNENLEKFVSKMKELATNINEKDLLPVINVDAEIMLEQVDWGLFEDLEKFEPFGEGNPKPKFLARGLNITNMAPVGKDNKHLRVLVNHGTPVVRKTIGFGFGNWNDKLNKDDKIDMIFEVDVNEWNGNRELQLRIIDLKKSDE